MRAGKVVGTILRAIPKSASWDRMYREAYGAFNVEPKADVRKVLYCVTVTQGIEEYFLDNKYDLLVSHHPIQPRLPLPTIIVHTALDCCKGGLNDQWRDGLGIKNAKHFDDNLGWYGKIDPIGYDALCAKVEAFMERKIIGQRFCLLDKISSVVVCSGLGGSVTREALRTGADCYIMGEAVMQPQYTGFPAIIETGHTNSEWIGARLIRKLLPNITVDVAPDSIDRYSGEVCRHVRFERGVPA